ncbi:MMPL family transporter [Microbacteriaceae bacterium 4G12]
MRTSVDRIDRWGRVGMFIHRFRFTFIAVFILLAASFSFFAPKLPSILGGDGFKTEGDYQVTQKILEKNFKQSQDTLILMFQKEKGASKQEFDDSIAKVMQHIEETETYTSLRSPLRDPAMKKEDVAYATILLKANTKKELTEKTLAFADKIQKQSTSKVKVSPTGYPVINDEINKRSQDDLKKAEMIGLPIAFIVLLLSFGSLGASVLPILNGGLSVISTMGILYFIGQKIELSIFVLNVAPMIGLALSIDFALLFVNRFREELETRSIKEAIAVTYQTAGRSIVFSGLCVFVGLSGLFFFQIDYIQSVAISGMIVVIMSILFSLTILPSVLSLMGKRFKQSKRKDRTGGFWRKFANVVMKRPIWMTLVVLIFIIVCLLPLRTMHLEVPGITALPENSDVRMAYERYENEFNKLTKTNADATIVVETKDNLKEQQGLQTLEKVVKKLEKDPDVQEVKSVYQVLNMPSEQLYMALQSPQKEQILPAFEAYTHNNQALVQVVLKAKPKSKEAKQWVRDFKKNYKEENVSYCLGGVTTFELELEGEIAKKMPLGMAFILGSTFLILMFAFRSLLIPLKAIIMNILSLSATIGMISWLFEGGHFGLEQSTVLLVLPVFIFGLVFGLSMDYEVFLISRIYELYSETKDNDYATLEGLVSTGRIITSAALIMIVVTGAFAFTDILPVKQMGIGVALAIFLDATIIRLLLVPSLMKMFGDWNWWLFNGKRKKTKEKYEH